METRQPRPRILVYVATNVLFLTIYAGAFRNSNYFVQYLHICVSSCLRHMFQFMRGLYAYLVHARINFWIVIVYCYYFCDIN